MSINRKNWSALSSLALRRTMEDEEEIEREKRRREKTSMSEPDADFSQTPSDTPTSDGAFGTDSTSEMSQGLSSVEQMQDSFIEMLRNREEKRQRRLVETLRRQKEVVEDEEEACQGGARVELLGDMVEEQRGALPSLKAAHQPQPPLKTVSHSTTNSSSNTNTNIANRQHENGESSNKDPKPLSSPTRKFVSSLSISLDKSPSASGCTSPMSPRSPTACFSPREHWSSPCQSPSPGGPRRPFQNGHTQETSENGSSSNCNFEQTAKPAFVRRSPRTISFMMMRKQEVESAPLQRSASMRMASRKFESNTDQNEDENKTSSFQRNSRQRISSRSIQEKMERLAQAAQKSEVTRSPDVTQRTLVRLEEVSRKRGLFEKEQQGASPTSPGVSRQEFRSFTSGVSDRINRLLNKSNQAEGSQSPTDLRHVDITGKRNLFETREEGGVPKTRLGKLFK